MVFLGWWQSVHEAVHHVQEVRRQPFTLTPVLSSLAESTGDAVPLQRSQSLPHSATVALAGTPDSSTPGGSALSEREAFRLDKFKQLLAGPNTDLGESGRPGPDSARASLCGHLKGG